MAEIKAITFDLDGVYFSKGKKEFVDAIGKLGVSENEAMRVFLKSDQMNHQYKEGKIGDDEFWTWAASEWKLDMSPDQFIKLLIEGYEVDERVAQTVRAARRQGYKTLVCSNNFPARIRGLQEKFHFLDDFDAAIFSCEVGASKPDIRIFSELINMVNLDPDSIVYADDDLSKLGGAEKLGMQTFVFTDFEQFMRELSNLGVSILHLVSLRARRTHIPLRVLATSPKNGLVAKL